MPMTSANRLPPALEISTWWTATVIIPPRPLEDSPVSTTSEQAASGIDDIDLQGDQIDGAIVASGEREAVESVASSGSLQEPDDEATDAVGMTMGMDWRTDRRRVAMESPEWDYPTSHLVFRVRAMTDTEFGDLVQDVGQHGLRLPIVRWRGEVIDGMHRLLACREAGAEPWFTDLDDDTDPELYVASANLFRRHLTEGERAELGASWSSESKRGRPPLSDEEKSANLRNKLGSLTQEESAKLVDISPKSVYHGRRVFSPDSSAIPELQQAVREDKVAVSDASAVVMEAPEIQQRAVDLVVSGESRTMVEGVRTARRESATRRSKDDEAVPPAYEKDGIRIYQEGVADLQARVKPGSVAVVLCAPHKDSSDATPALAGILASEVLNAEGLLVWQADPGRLPQQLSRMPLRKLEWICLVHLLFESPISNTGEPHNIDQRTVPLLLFGNSGARLDGGDDVMAVPPQPEESKSEPQSIRHAADLVIGRWVKPGQTVCIPELSGGSSSLLLAAARAGCRVIAADSEQYRIRRVVKELSKLKAAPFSDENDGS